MHPLKIQDKFSFFFVSFVSKLNCLGPSPRCLGTRHDTPPRPPFFRAADSCVIIARPPSCRGIVACTPIGVLLHPCPPLCRCTRLAPPCVSLHAPPLRVGARTPSVHLCTPHPCMPLARVVAPRAHVWGEGKETCTRRTAQYYSSRPSSFEFIKTLCLCIVEVQIV
jgi:hypothetical protein